MKRLLCYIKPIKVWIAGGVTLVLLIIGLLLANFLLKMNINNMELDKIDRVEYIEYEGQAFSSPILVKKVASIDGDKVVLEKLIDEINLYKRSKNTEKRCNRILFFYHKNEKVFNAYVADNLLGLNYGQNWIRVEGLKDILQTMNIESKLKTVGEKG